MKTIGTLFEPSEVLAFKPDPETPVLSLSFRSTDVSPGTLFFALRGKTQDGHLFVKEVVQKGALVVVDDRDVFHDSPNTILVKNTRRSLGGVASTFYDKPSTKLKVVGVTGTNGKTTTCFLLKEVWEKLGLKTGLVGTVHTAIGKDILSSELTTPDALSLQKLLSQMVERNTSHVAAEVSSIAMDQFRVTGTTFDVGIFTNLTQDHLDYHGDMESYFQAKRRFFADLKPKTNIFNLDDPWGRKLSQEFPGLTYSLKEKADFQVIEARFEKSVTRAKVKTPDGPFPLELPLIGEHNLYNSLGVLAASCAQGISLPKAIEVLQNAKGAPGRLECVHERPDVFVDYAHTPDALENVLRILKKTKTEGRLITVFGCGGDRDREKRPQMGEVASRLSDFVVVTSDNPRTENPTAIVSEIEKGLLASSETRSVVDRREAISFALSLSEPSDTVLIAGKGHENYQILGTEKVPFDDGEVVRTHFSKASLTRHTSN